MKPVSGASSPSGLTDHPVDAEQLFPSTDPVPTGPSGGGNADGLRGGVTLNIGGCVQPRARLRIHNPRRFSCLRVCVCGACV